MKTKDAAGEGVWRAEWRGASQSPEEERGEIRPPYRLVTKGGKKRASYENPKKEKVPAGERKCRFKGLARKEDPGKVG